MKTMGVCLAVIVLASIGIPGFAGELNLAEGIWFFEFQQEKMISIYEKGARAETWNRYDFSAAGNHGVTLCTMKNKNELHCEGGDVCSISLLSENTVIIENKGSDWPMVFQRVEDNEFRTATKRFLASHKIELGNPALSEERKSELSALVKETIPWDRVHMPLKHYLRMVKTYHNGKQEVQQALDELKSSLHEEYTVDKVTLTSMIGSWEIPELGVAVFSDLPVCEHLGFQFLKCEMKWLAPELHDISYTILKSKKDGKSYLYTLMYQTTLERPLLIVFEGEDAYSLYENGEEVSTARRQR